jgi:hypothetical protein
MRLFSLITAGAIALVALSVQAQPRKKGTPPPPPPVAAPAPAPALQPGVPPAPAVNSQGQPVADQPLLTRETEVRRALHFEAFIDGELSIVNKDWYPTRGFTLNDAAIYLSKDFGRGLSAMVDLPFASSSAAPATSTVNFGASQAQAYVQWMTGAWQAKFGQYDSIYGYERNDSRDRFFADAGLVKTLILPYTHVGAMVGYTISQVTLRGQIADPADTGTMTNQNPEFGLQARYDGDSLMGSAGLTFGDQKNGPGSNMLIDVTAGLRMDRLTGGIYFADKKTSGVDKHATGFGLQGVYDLSTDMGAGGRLEYVSDPSATIKNEFLITAGPSYRWMPDITLRGDLDVGTISPTAGENQTIFGVQGSLVASF